MAAYRVGMEAAMARDRDGQRRLEIVNENTLHAIVDRAKLAEEESIFQEMRWKRRNRRKRREGQKRRKGRIRIK